MNVDSPAFNEMYSQTDLVKALTPQTPGRISWDETRHVMAALRSAKLACDVGWADIGKLCGINNMPRLAKSWLRHTRMHRDAYDKICAFLNKSKENS